MAVAAVAHDFAVDDVAAYVEDLHAVGVVEVVF